MLSRVPNDGCILEGQYDIPVFEAIIPRIFPQAVVYRCLDCGGESNLMKKFPGYLRWLERIVDGRPVDKALVIRDSGGKEPNNVLTAMQSRIAGQQFSFPLGIQLCTVRREMETWLLADEEAINALAVGRRVGTLHGDIEEIVDPKEGLMARLTDLELDYRPSVCGQIAAAMKLEVLRYRSPSFRTFEQQVIDP